MERYKTPNIILVLTGIPLPPAARTFLATVSRPALGPTQPPIQRVPGALPTGVKRHKREANHSPPANAEVKSAWSYTFIPPIRFHGVVLSLKQRGNFTFTINYSSLSAYFCD
jgi:hypothetical protein